MMNRFSEHLEQRLTAVEPGLRRALVAGHGVDIGTDATAEAIAWACENPKRAAAIDNLGGYLYRVGQSAAKRLRGRDVLLDVWPVGRVEPRLAGIEPALQAAMRTLSERQREVVLMVHGYAYTQVETAELLGCSISAVRTHLKRAMERLRNEMEVTGERR